MKYVVYLLVLIVLCGLNVGLAPFMQIRGQAPNLLFLLVLVFALDKNSFDFLFLAFFGGLFLDFYSGAFLGSFTFSLLLAGFLLNIAVRQLLVLEINLKYLSLILVPSQAVLFFGFYFYNWIIFKAGLNPYFLNWKEFLPGFAVAFFYNLLLLYPVYILVGYVKLLLSKYLVREYKIR
jgi:rod shape-determining protein MreD